MQGSGANREILSAKFRGGILQSYNRVATYLGHTRFFIPTFLGYQFVYHQQTLVDILPFSRLFPHRFPIISSPIKIK